jgi:hypothetical protein
MSNSAHSRAAPNLGAATPLFHRDNVLRCPNETLHCKIAVLAIQLALLGHSETASSLISKLNKHDWYHTYSNRVRPLHLLWDLIGQWPEGELTRIHEAIQDRRQQEAKKKVIGDEGDETGKKVKLEVDESPITDEDVKKYVTKMYRSYATCWWYPERPHLWSYAKPEDLPLSPHDPKLKLSAGEVKTRIQSLLEAMEEQKKTPGRLRPGAPTIVMPAEALVSALDLRIQLQEMGSTEFADIPSAEDILSRIAKALGERGVIDELVQSQRAWSLLKDGILLKLLNINKPKLDLFASQLEDAITSRLETGRQNPPTPSIASLLDNTLTHPDSIEWFEQMDRQVPSTILHLPASNTLIDETESRLGTTLPEDYKEYLRITNGNDNAFGGIIREAPLFKCEDIRWIADDEEYFYELTLDIPHNSSQIARALTGDGGAWPNVGKGIIIGEEDIDSTFLIKPDTVKEVKDKVRSILENEDVSEDIKKSLKNAVQDFAGSVEVFEEMDWCLVTWASGGAAQMDGHSSFTAYLRHVAEHSKVMEKDCWNLGYSEFVGYRFVEKAE